jgi:hypothetical protein
MWQGAAGGERVADPQPHGRADRQGGDVAGGEPPGVAGLDLVPGGAAAQRAGVEADRERLADQPVARVGDDVAGVGVDAGQPGDLHGDADSSAVSRTAASDALSPGSTCPPGSSQSPVSQRRTSSIRPVMSRTAANADGATQLAAGASG